VPSSSPRLRSVENEANESRLETIFRLIKIGMTPWLFIDIDWFFADELDKPECIDVVYPTLLATELNA